MRNGSTTVYLSKNYFSAKNYEKIYSWCVISIKLVLSMSIIEAYDIKARKKVPMNNPQPYLMKNGMWALKGTSSETGIKLFKIVGKTKPSVGQSRFEAFKKLFTSK